jgi:hypothetical protein
VVHLLADGCGLEIVFAILGAWFVGAVPAFGEASLSDAALIDQANVLIGRGPYWGSVLYCFN